MENVPIPSFSRPFSSAFRLNKERYSVSLRIQSECGKIQTRKTPNADTFQAVLWSNITNIPDRKLQQIKGKFEILATSTLNIHAL